MSEGATRMSTLLMWPFTFAETVWLVLLVAAGTTLYFKLPEE